MTTSFLHAWIASIPGIGPKHFAQLQSLFPDLSSLWTDSVEQLQAAGVRDTLASTIAAHRKIHSPNEIQAYCEQHHITILTQHLPQDTPNSSQYPFLLSQIPDPPIVLYVKGTVPDFSLPSIAIVGTRQVTPYGAQVTAELTKGLVEKGFVIVSGFMYGVDAIAHSTAMDTGGKTIGVLGFGLEHMYPSQHKVLAQRMFDTGNTLITEFAPWVSAKPMNFPLRNRIVAGLCAGVVVTEAASKSGSKITARLAVEQGREVFAVPGPMHSQYSEGTKELVNMGAKLVTCVDDIIEELL